MTAGVAPPIPARVAGEHEGALELHPERTFLRRRTRVAIRELPGFVRGRHRVPSERGVAAERFIQELGRGVIEQEIATLYASCKRALGLRRRQLVQASAEGGGNLDAPTFRYLVELGQDEADPSLALWRRELRLLVEPSTLAPGFDALFTLAFDELVVPFSGSRRFDEVVDRLEDFGERCGGVVEEREAEGRAWLVGREGSELEFDLGRGELCLRVRGCEGGLALFDEARRRFGWFGTSFGPG